MCTVAIAAVAPVRAITLDVPEKSPPKSAVLGSTEAEGG